MITNADITIWRTGVCADTRMDVWERVYFTAVSLQFECCSRTDRNGAISGDTMHIRIPSDQDLMISPGDKVCVGNIAGDIPPDNALTITSVSDNRKGRRRMWHWKCRVQST